MLITYNAPHALPAANTTSIVTAHGFYCCTAALLCCPQAFVLLAITLLLCRRDASCSDLVLVLCCFATAPSSPTQSCTEPASSSHPNTTTTALPMVQRMRYLSLLAPLLLVSCAGTPLMLLLWVQRGTGNANFVFFLGLGYSVAIIIGVVEFTRSAMRQRGRGSSYW